MSFHAVIDTSAFIWDRKAYEQNAKPFFELTSQLESFTDVFEAEKPKIYLRKSLLDEMINGFPGDLETKIPNFSDLSAVIYHFLFQLGDQIMKFEEFILNDIYSEPNIILEHYNEIVKKELIYLISEIHSTTVLVVYFSFEAIWETDDSLSTHCDGVEKKYETIIHPSNNQLKTFFNRYKPFFEHNPKHDRIKGRRWEGGEEVFPLSCYDGEDNSIPQTLLSTALKHKERLYNYDTKNSTVVRFVSSGGNKFHGFDEPKENVPLEIKKHFHIK